MHTDLLKEVIADAKVIKETAKQAAMSSLSEAFEPTVRQLISQKLQEEGDYEEPAEDEAAEPVVEGDYIDDGDDGTPANNLEEMEEPEMEDEFDAELDEVLAELEGEVEEEEPELEMPAEPVAEPAPAPAPELPVDDDDEITEEMLDEILAEMEGEEEPAVEESAEVGTLRNTVSRLRAENAELKEQLSNAMAAVNEQRNTLNQLNLLNSKLQYVTKLNSKFKLSESQKVSLIEAFDNCSNVREVKLTFTNWATLLKESVNKKESPKTRVNESASRPTRAVVKKSSDDFAFASRFQKLAGIK